MSPGQVGARTDLTVMVPALNEGSRLRDTLATLCRAFDKTDGLCCEVLVIDDGSTDETGAVADELARRHPFVRVIHHAQNRGIGASLREAIREARGERFLIVPGDNDMPLDTVTALLSRLGVADLVMCYFPDRRERGPLRNLISDLFGSIYMTAFGLRLRYINGPCVYPTRQLAVLDLISRRFSIVAEINVKLLRQGLSYLQVPGNQQTGAEGSGALSLTSLFEVVRVFLSLVWQVHVSQRALFSKRPQEVAS